MGKVGVGRFEITSEVYNVVQIRLRLGLSRSIVYPSSQPVYGDGTFSAIDEGEKKQEESACGQLGEVNQRLMSLAVA